MHRVIAEGGRGCYQWEKPKNSKTKRRGSENFMLTISISMKCYHV